ncbi:CxxH/CxxC protein [Isobaculum melis]|uniref:CxxH/CxxC protein, BA_5709 family n=1 Tax=Isobaculum melis TaxID=142588 RepID=A0A1H9TTW9_9LACT|nr:CxxH/CxxC protein [Isobaculum melis]SES00431.1 CxxH/CxxC protein, BA_5709 family [Isobaculum melis]
MKEKFVCENHIEEALDDAVFEENAMPVMNVVSDVDKLGMKCAYCEQESIYIVTNIHSDTK